MGADSLPRDNSADSEVGNLPTTQAGGTARKGKDTSGSRASGRAGTGSTIDSGDTAPSGGSRAKGSSPKRATNIRTID